MKSVFVIQLSATILLFSIDKHACVNIFGGNETVPHSRPYMAIIRGSDVCGGVLIDDRWVLTTASCYIDRSTIVILGAHTLTRREKEKQKFKVLKAIPHHLFNEKTYEHDIQVLQLSRKAQLGHAVGVLPLPKNNEDVIAGTVCETAGWGKTEYNLLASKLMQVNLTVIDRKECNEQWKSNPKITENMICTSDKKEIKDTCHGDGGGPLICDGVFRGLTSFGSLRCGQLGATSVFTRLTEDYICWIYEGISSVL